jgi:hypothetical protein
LHYTRNTYQFQSADDHLKESIDRFCTSFISFCIVFLINIKQQLQLDSSAESQPNLKELKGAKRNGHTTQIPSIAQHSIWKVNGTIAKLGKWRAVIDQVCLEKVYLDEKSNYNPLLGQSEPNRAN